MTQKKNLINEDRRYCGIDQTSGEISGYKLHVEVDGVNGYRAIEEKPDLVILDLMLPGENGRVCRK